MTASSRKVRLGTFTDPKNNNDDNNKKNKKIEKRLWHTHTPARTQVKYFELKFKETKQQTKKKHQPKPSQLERRGKTVTKNGGRIDKLKAASNLNCH